MVGWLVGWLVGGFGPRWTGCEIDLVAGSSFAGWLHRFLAQFGLYGRDVMTDDDDGFMTQFRLYGWDVMTDDDDDGYWRSSGYTDGM